MFKLIPGQLSILDICNLLKSKESIELNESAYENIEASYNIVQKKINEGQSVYGINTGFGLLANTKIAKEDLKTLQRKIVLSHATGVGEDLDEETVRLIMLLKINSLGMGYSGVSQNLIKRLIAVYNSNIYPVVPKQGSVGASGDLAPLAHVALTLIGEGESYYNNIKMPSKDALEKANINPIELIEKEGLAILNGTQVSTAIAIIGLLKTQRNFAIASISGALSIDAQAGSIKPFSEFIARAKNNHGQLVFSRLINHFLDNSSILEAHGNCERIQDPYSLRGQPQVMGAIWTYLTDSQKHLLNEANGVSDNPLVSIETEEIISGGNFHAELTAISADLITINCAEIGSISERRIALLIDKNLSGLPAFLVDNSGVNSGFMMAQVTAAALASENKTYAHPASVDNIPTSANQEDHVSMATFAAVKLNKVADNVLTILAIETLAANQGIDFRAPLKTSPNLEKYTKMLRDKVPFYSEDRYLGKDIIEARELISKYSYYGEIRNKLFHMDNNV
ncbi:MAG: histidine ammonia-lyase [Legionellaceae bacterium]|nr:histidine ammonia-lyase [Legionellaceae bacterium]